MKGTKANVFNLILLSPSQFLFSIERFLLNYEMLLTLNLHTGPCVVGSTFEISKNPKNKTNQNFFNFKFSEII